MKKEYEAPKAEKLEFAYYEVVVASGCGGIYKKFTHEFEGCHSVETDEWVNPYGNGAH